MKNIDEAEILWWFGVLHTDCYVHKKCGKIVELRLLVSEKSLPMLIKWKRILDQLTGKEHWIERWKTYDKRYDKSWMRFVVRDASFSRIAILLQKIPCPMFGDDFAEWIRSKPLGPYLAGVIDGDGHIQIRKRYFDRGYEKLMKITDCKSDNLLLIQKLLVGCGMPKGYITEYKNHSDLWVYINKNFEKWLINNVAPYLTIERKLRKILPSEAQVERAKLSPDVVV
ncbi:MAG: hypothetical protein FJY76_01765 [Candidatus Aenigmarchaeota archaeon]|nr:hypothetical protein [Candidatus Aenigmarchaeota archaeon]